MYNIVDDVGVVVLYINMFSIFKIIFNVEEKNGIRIIISRSPMNLLFGGNENQEQRLS